MGLYERRSHWLHGAVLFVASTFYPYLADYFTRFEDVLVRNGIAIAALFIATLIVGAVVNYVISSLVQKRGCQAQIVFWGSASVRCVVY